MTQVRPKDGKKAKFPAVADGEVLLAQMPVMSLYEESDLISNIKGDYQEKTQFVRQLSTQKDPAESMPQAKPAQDKPRLSSNARAYQAAAQGVKPQQHLQDKLKKSYHFDQDKAQTVLKPNLKREIDQPTAKLVNSNPVSHLTSPLQQDSYILADTPPQYQPGANLEAKQVLKNSYDFLKSSQVYNYPEGLQKREFKVAQELNLAHLADK